jgi:hypothetical protein
MVLYIMGAGRSGSTVLGVTLGNCDGLFYAGELDAWLSRSGSPQLEDEPRMRFWRGVREQVPGAGALFGRSAERSLERSLSLFRVNLWGERRRLRAPYRTIAESLYRAVSVAAGAPVIIDSSHYPLRARELQDVVGIDLHLLFLIRDPRSVAASFSNTDVAQYTKSTLTTNVYLWLTHLLAVWVFLRQPRARRMVVRYEDFAADPQRVVGDILRAAHIESAPPDFSSLRTGLAFQGNRLLHSETIALKGPGGSPAGRSALTALLQAPLQALLNRLEPVAAEGP